MLDIFRLEEGRLILLPPDAMVTTMDNHWFEMVDPTPAELQQVQALCSEPLPDVEEIEELEASSHHLVFEQGFQSNCLFFYRPEGEPNNFNVSFLYNQNGLITISLVELPHFRLLHIRNRKLVDLFSDTLSIFFALLEIKVDGLADEMEQSYRELEAISNRVLGRKQSDLDEAIDGLAAQEDLVGKVRLCLMDGQRDIRFIMRQPMVNKRLRKVANELLADIQTIMPHNDFLSEKADFLLNATQGFIVMEQNRIMKIFSVTALIFLPPTFIAAIYGMNFQFMPELSQPWGYPAALAVMLLAAGGPFLYFKLKKWL
ncbi:MAG: magnesium transporter CorA [Gammaproteobacteria bacterium]|nr:magnesium transporter CorA [Gammaproteobacteria bacterium]